jgi:hypothetical protein
VPENFHIFQPFGSTLFINGLQSMQSRIGCGRLPLIAKPIEGLADLKKARRAVAFVVYFRSPTRFQELHLSVSRPQ